MSGRKEPDSTRVWIPLVLLGVAIWTSGCAMNRLQKDIDEAATLGLIAGEIQAPEGGDGEILVVLFRDSAGGRTVEAVDRLEGSLRTYVFILDSVSTYHVAAFRDRDGDLLRDPGEPVGSLGPPGPIRIAPDERRLGQDFGLGDDAPRGLSLDLRELDVASMESVRIAAGEIRNLDHEAFSARKAGEGMWTPLTSMRQIGTGVYFLEEYDPTRIPILFVHGIGGTPQDFRFLIDHLDRSRYQPWVFHYPSGVRLHRLARLLDRIVSDLQEDLGFDTLYVTAHSMGGLVSRAFLLRSPHTDEHDFFKLFVTFSTPWNGHRAAKMGVKWAPATVPAWIDMQPDSEFLQAVRADLPPGIPHHLFFGFDTKGFNPMMTYSHDSVVSVSSQLARWAQATAVRIYGYDLDHVEILADAEVLEQYSAILDQASESGN